MLFKKNSFAANMTQNYGMKVLVIALLWLLLISALHHTINAEETGRNQLTMGYMPVVTNLAAPLLDYATRDGDGIRFKALKFSSFAEMAESLRNGQIDAAFIIAPLAVELRQQKEDVKIVYIGNRHESTLVARKDLGINNIHGLAGKTVAVPMRYSGHNLSMLQLLDNSGLEGRVKIVEMNPPDMAASLSNGSLDAYYVGEPFAATTLQSGDASLVHYVESVWDGFICNLVLVRQDLIDREPDMVKALVNSAARSGLWAQNNIQQAARIAALYWNQSPDLVEYAMSTPANRIVYDRFVPVEREMQEIADKMLHYGLSNSNDISGLVYDQFARDADLQNINELESILSL